MSLQIGDRVTVALSPAIRYAKYDSLKVHVSVTRELTDPEADLADMRTELRRLFHIALGEELGLLDHCFETLANPDEDADPLDVLRELVQREIGDVIERATTERTGSSEGEGGKKASQEKGKGAKKGRARKKSK